MLENTNVPRFLITKMNEYFSSDENKVLYANAYFNRINKEYDGFLLKAKDNPNYSFILGIDMLFESCGVKNKCEQNTYNFIKDKLENGETKYYPVGGYMFMPKSLFPVEHWWVYNSETNEHIEVTPFIDAKPWCYAGIINKDINTDILNSNIIWDISFFKGGNTYITYFK